MDKFTLSGRRLLCLLLILAVAAALLGCAQSAETPLPAATAPVAVVDDTDTSPEAAPAPDEPETAAPTPEAAPAAEPLGPGLFLTAEYDRLYFAPLDGSAVRLVADKTTEFTTRWGEWLYAAFEDGSVTRFRLADGSCEELLPAGGRMYRELIPFDGGFIAVYYSMREGAGYELYRDGSQTPIPLFADKPMLMCCSVGQYIYTRLYDKAQGSRLAAYDKDSLELCWEVPVDSSVKLLRDEDGILCFIPNKGLLYRLDEDAQALVPVDIPLTVTDYELTLSSGGAWLVRGNWSDNYRCYLINADGRQELPDAPQYFSLMDVSEGKALLRSIGSGESAAADELWYKLENYTLLDLESGQLSELPVQGVYSALFAEGDFPVMDSSTARKPITAELYAFFCESSGAGGALPLCSTTHGAWLNIADGGADLALLAAPTQEEQDYLDERGVSVEMKLYGGDGLVFIGNRACGVEDLSLDQVRGIYRGEITNWAQLGGADHAIRVLYRDDQSGSQRLFERMLWTDEPVPDAAALGFERLDDMSSIVSECLRDPYAIGYSIMTYLKDVYGSEDLLAFSLEGYAATPENVAARNYPLGTQGYVVIRADEPESSPARRLFDFFGSPLSDVILTRNGVTPLHEGE